ncbi:hypothetical protein RhiirC2_788429 [Rhizophagus irregularis]|uniref:Uncharacterized protein n=1 Tax=Rhizophagus irregularis TaxID=588596 RepID=A0A2N1MQ66_9GLOM|nr:hypothetical protein RhiirC2_788429 [Rhizophagus irregularis]
MNKNATRLQEYVKTCISSFSLDSDIPIWYPVPSLDFLVGFLDIGRLLALVIFFVGWYLAELVVTKLDLKTYRRTPDASLDTNQTLRTRRSMDFKSASLDYKEGNSAVGSSGSGLRTHGLNGGVSFFGDLSLFFQL